MIKISAPHIRRLKEEARDEVKRLRGDYPYNHPSNICYGDPYYAQSLKEKYGITDIQKIWEWANS